MSEAASVRTAACGKDRFPKFTGVLTAAQQQKVDHLKAELVKVNIVIRNTNDVAVSRMKGADTKASAQQRHKMAVATKEGILKQATMLYFEIEDARDADTMSKTLPGSFGVASSSSSNVSISREELLKMMQCAATMAISSQKSHTLAIEDGVVDHIRQLDNKVDNVVQVAAQQLVEDGDPEVKEKAAELMLQDESNIEELNEAAIEKIIENGDVTEDAIEKYLEENDVRDEAVTKYIEDNENDESFVSDVLEKLSKENEDVVLELARRIKRARKSK